MLEASAPDLISILGDAPSMENLRNLARVRRDYAERIVETLIDALDAIDGDPDLEPSLGSGNACLSTGRFTFGRRRRARVPMADHLAFAQGATDDREEQDEDGTDLDQGEDQHDGGEPDVDDEDGADREQSLGAPDGRISQAGWADGENDDRERDDDTEPTLGQPEGIYHNQTLWGRIGGRAHEDEEDFRSHPGHREGTRLMEAA